LKPENILLNENGAAKITDFGLARREIPDSSSTATLTWEQNAAGGASGTPAYMAPELIEGSRSSTASDVFALGAVLYEMFTGRKVIEGTSVLEVFQNIRTLDADRVAEDVPAAQREIVRQALQAVPRLRPTMAQIAEELSGNVRS
jgi:serine/threonine protein kinase